LRFSACPLWAKKSGLTQRSKKDGYSITSSAQASSVGGTVPVTNTAAHRNFRAQAAAKREQLLAQLA